MRQTTEWTNFRRRCSAWLKTLSLFESVFLCLTLRLKHNNNPHVFQRRSNWIGSMNSSTRPRNTNNKQTENRIQTIQCSVERTSRLADNYDVYEHYKKIRAKWQNIDKVKKDVQNSLLDDENACEMKFVKVIESNSPQECER